MRLVIFSGFCFDANFHLIVRRGTDIYVRETAQTETYSQRHCPMGRMSDGLRQNGIRQSRRVRSFSLLESSGQVEITAEFIRFCDVYENS